jgi:hypothetical protein
MAPTARNHSSNVASTVNARARSSLARVTVVEALVVRHTLTVPRISTRKTCTEVVVGVVSRLRCNLAGMKTKGAVVLSRRRCIVDPALRPGLPARVKVSVIVEVRLLIALLKRNESSSQRRTGDPGSPFSYRDGAIRVSWVVFLKKNSIIAHDSAA